jgi:hypothetical protein
VSCMPTWAEFFFSENNGDSCPIGRSLNGLTARGSYSHAESHCLLHGQHHWPWHLMMLNKESEARR